MKEESRKILVGFTRSYYWGTCIFLFLDKVLGIDIRVSAFTGHPHWQNDYYVFCFVCLGLILWKPAATLLVSMIESAVNITSLCLGIMLPIFNMPGEVLSGGPVSQVTMQMVANFVISCSVCIWSFYGYFMTLDSKKQ